MKIKNAQYVITAVKPEQYPNHRLPELAMVGRSNAGKSSLINTLVGQKNLARVASTPGKTREINFYNLDQQLFLADLPGYGYAKVSKEKKESWGEMIETYLNTREQLKLIIMLVDIRHAPSIDDQTMYEWIRSKGTPFIVVATKSDKIPRSQTVSRLKEICSVLKMGEEEQAIPFSSVTKQGMNEVWKAIDRIFS
ncbi:MAG TPA: ribosome biogenesis GTP-binding protein YihA/YsxC [Bacillota bacterium]|jgi:GTP-binding protein|nr:ribosome biogenesis GTP-binding protein YihA/YsxC [Bacillota bacterium]